jgi:nucleotide-binding universal stress UspA family protein
VVGVDGSDDSLAALAFAYEEAELRGDRLVVLYAWHVPNRWAEGFNPEWPADHKAFREAAGKRARDLVDKFLAGKPWPSWMEVIAVEEYPPVALLAQAKNARMLVVGSRGRGGFASMLLGSVSTACVHHAPCPVTVVRPPVPS